MHGIGLINIDMVVEKYDGVIQRYIENIRFISEFSI